MEIQDQVANIELFFPRGITADYLAEVDESIKEIDSQRPLQPHITEKLQSEILYDRVHASAVIEGNKLSRRETIVVLSTGIIEAGSRKDQQEVINLADACIYLQECLDNKAPLSVQLIKEIHQKILTNIDAKNAGCFRSVDVAISGAKVSPPSHLDVPNLIESIVSLENSAEAHPIQIAAWIHWAFARIHPFVDGNGRVARLVQDYVLLKNNYVPASVQPEDRERNYYEALESADLGNGEDFLEIIAKNVLRTSERYLSIIRDEQSKSIWIEKIAKAASEKVKQTEHRKFLITQKTYDSLKHEFESICSELNSQLTDMRVNFKDYGSLDFEKYLDLKSKGRATRTWLFGLNFKYGEIDQRFIFWFDSHYRSAQDIRDFGQNAITILLSMQDSAGGYKKLEDFESEDRITLRELLVVDRGFFRKRYNPVSRNLEWDEDISPTDIAQNFIQEVLAKVGLI